MKYTISVQKLIDLSVEENLVPDAKFHYRWQEFSDWQFNALKQIGLEPQHFLLDVGCGPMRLGMQAIPYLEDGHYFGIDAFLPYISLGKKILSELEIHENYGVLDSKNFEFEKFGVKFDFAIAQSVFTHLSLSQIQTCVASLKRVMKANSKLLFTYLVRNSPIGFLYDNRQPMVYSAFCDDRFFNQIALEYNITFSMSHINHPTQSVGIFQF
ncbi:MAG: methyltransferase [Thermodesulfobacteriota bacterium]